MKQFATDQFKNGNKDQVFGKKSNESYDCGWIDDQSGDKSPMVGFSLDLETMDLSNFGFEGATVGYAWSDDYGDFIINSDFQLNSSNIDSIAFNAWNPTFGGGVALKVNDYSTYKAYQPVGHSFQLVVSLKEGEEVEIYAYKPNTAQNNTIHYSTSTLIFNIINMKLIKQDYEDQEHVMHHEEVIAFNLVPAQNFIEDTDNNAVYRAAFIATEMELRLPVEFTIYE